jgi:glucokinase
MRLIGGDIGGTKTLLRCVENGRTLHEARFGSMTYATFDDVLRDFLRGVEGPFDAACFAVAGPVLVGRAEVTNVGWTMEERALASSFSLGRVSLINDFYGIALGVPLLDEGELVPLQRGARDRNAPIAILGVGTGLGQAIVLRGQVLPTEGGHADFAPQDEEQTRLFLMLHRRFGHVSWERVLSGAGLSTIYEFLGGGDEVSPARIAELADGGEARAARAFDIFVDAYGSEAGNMALQCLARGGVYLAGGIAAKNIARFTDGKFIEAFVRKGRFRKLLETIPVDLVTRQDVGLIGALEQARRAATPHTRRAVPS